MLTQPHILQLGARGSLLSRLQSQQVAHDLMSCHPGLTVHLHVIATTGDAITDQPLHAFGGKGLFTREIELALLNGIVDFAVHSFKDVPITMPLVDQSQLMIAAVPQREDARDVLVSFAAKTILDLPRGATVGTGSLRRQAQLLALRPDLRVSMIRGNIDTRIRKLKEKQFDAILLACAGLRRANLFDPEIMTPIEPDHMLPAAGQGALALQCAARSPAPSTAQNPATQPHVAQHPSVSTLLSVLHHAPTALAVRLEREIVLRLQGDCHSPIAAYATQTESHLHLRVAVGKKNGFPPIFSASATAPLTHPDAAVDEVLERLTSQNVLAHLHT